MQRNVKSSKSHQNKLKPKSSKLHFQIENLIHINLQKLMREIFKKITLTVQMQFNSRFNTPLCSSTCKNKNSWKPKFKLQIISLNSHQRCNFHEHQIICNSNHTTSRHSIKILLHFISFSIPLKSIICLLAQEKKSIRKY